MKYIFSTYVVLMIIVLFPARAQQQYILRGRVLLEDQPIKNTTVEVGSFGSTITNENGYFEKGINSETNSVVINVFNPQPIIIPPNGKVDVTKDQNAIVQIHLGSNREKLFFEDLQNRIKNISNVQNLTLTEMQESFKKLASDMEEQKEITVEKIKLEYYLAEEAKKKFKYEGQLKAMPVLSKSLDNYISRSKDLVENIDQNIDRLFYDTGKATKYLSLVIKDYTAAYEELNMTKEEAINLVEVYWQAPYLTQDVRNLYQMALKDTHENEALLANFVLEEITKFNERRKGRLSKSEIKFQVNKTVYELQKKIAVLENERTRVFQQLKSI